MLCCKGDTYCCTAYHFSCICNHSSYNYLCSYRRRNLGHPSLTLPSTPREWIFSWPPASFLMHSVGHNVLVFLFLETLCHKAVLQYTTLAYNSVVAMLRYLTNNPRYRFVIQLPSVHLVYLDPYKSTYCWGGVSFSLVLSLEHTSSSCFPAVL
jgi:hypothetical protein